MTKLKDIEVTPPKPLGRMGRLLKPLTLPTMYVVWAALAAMASWLGIIEINPVGAIIMIVGSVVTNAYFIGMSHSIEDSYFGEEALPGWQSAIAIFWIAVFCHLSFGSREIAMGMYATVLIFALFRLERYPYNRLLLFAAATYLIAVGGRGVFDTSAVNWASEIPAFLGLLALLIGCHVFHMQYAEQRSYYVYRNYELQVILQRLTRIAKRDHLTRSYNRRYIMEAMAREKSRADRSDEEEFSVCILDLDHFKKLNDKFGHVAGDRVLLNFAKRIRSELRGMDTLNQSRFERSFGRFGGEEFIAVLPNTDVDGARRCAERLCEAISQKPFLGKYDVTVSVGAATYIRGETIPELLSRADSALYEAKERGRNRIRVATAPDDSDKTIPEVLAE